MPNCARKSSRSGCLKSGHPIPHSNCRAKFSTCWPIGSTENGRELEGAVNRLFMTWQTLRTPISVEVVETIIRDLVQGIEPRRIKIEDILRIVRLSPWQDDASAYAFARMADGALSQAAFTSACPPWRTSPTQGTASARAGSSWTSCSRSRADPPPGVEQGGTARVAFAVLDVARRSVAAGLVHPHLQAADGRWHALWGATLDDHVRAELDAIAHAAPAASAEAFDGDTQAFVDDLYGCAVDELARRALRDAGVGLSVSLAASRRRGRALPRGARRSGAGAARRRRLPGARAARRRLGGRRPRTSLARAVEPRAAPRRERRRAGRRRRGRAAGRARAVARGGRRPDPRPARRRCSTGGADEVFAFLRESDPRRALDLRLATIGPVLADAGIVLDGDPPSQRGARRRAGARVPPARHASPRGARRAGAASPRVGRVVEPRPRQPRRDRARRRPPAGS